VQVFFLKEKVLKIPTEALKKKENNFLLVQVFFF